MDLTGLTLFAALYLLLAGDACLACRLSREKLEARKIFSANPCGDTPGYQWQHGGAYCRDPIDTSGARRFLNGAGKLRETGGLSVTPGYFPSFAFVSAIKLKGGKERRETCGGALIGKDRVITAAQCVMNERIPGNYFHSARSIRVTLGVTNINDNQHSQEFKVYQTCFQPNVTINPSREPFMIKNDWAILILDKSATYNNYVQPICIAKDYPNEDAQCYALGFGKGSSSGEVKYIPVKYGCKSDMRLDAKFYSSDCFQANLPNYPGDICPSDYGSPIVCIDQCPGYTSKQYIMGIASYTENQNCVEGSRYPIWCTNIAGNYIRHELSDTFNSCQTIDYPGSDERYRGEKVKSNRRLREKKRKEEVDQEEMYYEDEML